MRINKRLFPYPVLCGDTDDYTESTEFILEPIVQENLHELIFEYGYTLKCDSLETLIRKGQAEYVLHIECSATSFRIALKSSVPSISYRLPKSRVNGEVSLIAMIVAKVDIHSYNSSDLNEDYIGESVFFKKGSILAYQNLPSVYVTKKTEELSNAESFFSVVKHTGLDPEEIEPLSFNLYNEKIQIIVDAKTYESFVHLQHSQSIAIAMLVLPALAYMIAEIRDNYEALEQYLWFQRLAKFYAAQGKNFVEDVLHSAENPVMIAQEMLQNPVSKSYREIYAMEG